MHACRKPGYPDLFGPYFCCTFSDTEEANTDKATTEACRQISSGSTPPPMMSMVELFNQRQENLLQRKLRIAELSNSILENPQESVSCIMMSTCIIKVIIVMKADTCCTCTLRSTLHRWGHWGTLGDSEYRSIAKQLNKHGMTARKKKWLFDQGKMSILDVGRTKNVIIWKKNIAV